MEDEIWKLERKGEKERKKSRKMIERWERWNKKRARESVV